ncbi:helix-turn-helix domain-containing protein [Lacticigenium naphthae]|uniref:helix-turn-helix domain-containing protein n=1 Tax=Lacticigenium naphthae TaxID=515351 RepID=UPI0004187926|nr:helix-turn-helix domain-containing protein [Lacticigenium naphthae]
MDTSAYTVKTIILALIGSQKEMKAALLYSILVGKRTPSVLFQAKRLGLENYFSLFEQLTREQFQQILKKLITKQFVQLQEADVYTVPSTVKERSRYTSKDQLDTYLLGFFRYQKLLPVFWIRFQLFIQIVSEKRHQKVNYRPITNELSHQRWIKGWILQNQDDFAGLAEEAAGEIFSLLASLPQEKAELVTLLLTGHEKNGRTMNQLKELWAIKSNTGFLLLLIQTQLLLVRYIQESPERYKHLAKLLASVDKETFYGLNESTFVTVELLKSQSIEEIAHVRNLKIGTIKEHILEIALSQDHFSVADFIPQERKETIKKLQEEEFFLPFKMVQKKVGEIDFFHYRLLQIERMRKHGYE